MAVGEGKDRVEKKGRNGKDGQKAHWEAGKMTQAGGERDRRCTTGTVRELKRDMYSA